MLLSSCLSGIDGRQYASDAPSLKPEEFFDGKVKAWGIIQYQSGNLASRFTAELEGSWDGPNGVLNEVFTYHGQSEAQARQWRITKVGDFSYRGEADDVVGTATGRQHGNAMNWKYVMEVPVGDSKYTLRFDDWSWALEDGAVMNRIYMKKLGFTVAEVTIFLQKVG